MKPDIYYGTVLKTCRDFDIILVNNFIDRVTVTGNFSYVKGKSSKCTSSSVSATAYSASWKISNKSSSKSGNTATASATVLQYSGARPVNSVTRKVSLTCDVNGNLS